ncbi:Pfs, NACHT and Ankyrin domain-containing protein [Cordyceps javanica]|uniref:Pfs, NACHT and Ankyrin domain-containing protein n=1 Tax=Cordyceps javanica TaxID=43265 RepID=A0A545V1S4_9HYPO|nr:Pfs, NACHT and Ankyrin domain-containing protein [Cordyceps javanica]TQW07137.1 Pfs, NACHT and Ankyrin domain protein [Cordyceps javanica]
MKVEESMYGELAIKSHRVIGGDSSREVERRPEVARKPGEYIRFTSSEIIDLDDFVKFAEMPREEQCPVVTESHSTLKSLYALEIFSAFMWAVAKTLDKPIEQYAEILPCAASSNDGWRSFTLRSSRLLNMAREIESTGLGSLEDVYLSIIPPLSAQQKLPQVQAIIELVREHTKQHEEQQQWKDATEKYQWLWQLAKTFPLTSMFAIKATAVLVEYLGRVMMAVEFAKTQRHSVDQALRYCEYHLKKELDSADRKTISRLEQEYELYELGRKGPSMLKGQSSVAEAEFHRQYRDRSENCGKETKDRKDEFERTALHYNAVLGHHHPFAEANDGHVNVADLSGWTPLHYACLWGNVDMVQFLVGKNAAIEARSRDGEAPLHCAAVNQEPSVVSFLVGAGVTVDIMDAWGSTPLQWAIHRGHEDVIERLWPHANKRLRDRRGRTALHYAANAGRLYPTNLSDWKNSADIDAKDARGWTPLHLAAASGHEGIVRQLTDIGADIEARENQGQTPIYLATKNGHEAATKLLVELGANLAVRACSGTTLLYSTAEGGNAAIAELLIDKGVKIDGNHGKGANTEAKNCVTTTPLHVAAEGGHEAIARLLITKGANIEAQDRAKQTPLHVAAEGGHEAIARLLITKGVNIEAENYVYATPLHVAAKGGHEAIARLLITKGANIEAEDRDKKTPLHLAVSRGHEAIARLLITKGADIGAGNCKGSTPLHTAASYARVSIAKMLIESGAVIDAKDHFDRAPLHDAGCELVAMLLIENGADRDAKGYRGETPLHRAVEEECEHLVRVLIANGANMELENDENMTPLQTAVQEGKHEMAEQLIKAGANHQVRDKGGETLLHMAAQDDCSNQMARLLIQHGAEIDARDNKGQTPLHTAATMGSEITVNLLVEFGADKEARDNSGWTPRDRAGCNRTGKLLEVAIQLD